MVMMKVQTIKKCVLTEYVHCIVYHEINLRKGVIHHSCREIFCIDSQVHAVSYQIICTTSTFHLFLTIFFDLLKSKAIVRAGLSFSHGKKYAIGNTKRKVIHTVGKVAFS